MKKTNLLVIVCSIVTIVLLSSCVPQPSKGESTPCENDPKKGIEGYFCEPVKEGRPESVIDYPEVVSMLKAYDTTRSGVLEKSLGHEDTRFNTFDFSTFINYLNYVQKATKKLREKGIQVEISGISFISAVKPNRNKEKSLQHLIYVPTTIIDGKEVQFDPIQSLQQGRLVTFKQALANYGYNWIYNTKEEWEKGKRDDYNYTIKKSKNSGSLIDVLFGGGSGVGNRGTLNPPYGEENDD